MFPRIYFLELKVESRGTGSSSEEDESSEPTEAERERLAFGFWPVGTDAPLGDLLRERLPFVRSFSS